MSSICDAYILSCAKYDKPGQEAASWVTDSGENKIIHRINNKYEAQIPGLPEPLIIANTVRNFEAIWKRTSVAPDKMVALVGTDMVTVTYCQEPPPGTAALSVSESCKITTSTLHYLDHRYGVCLYRKIITELVMDIQSDLLTTVRTTMGNSFHHMAQIQSKHYEAGSFQKEEWHLVVAGDDRILSTIETKIHPFGDIKKDDIRQILLFDQPPSQADILDPLVKEVGFYDYGNDDTGESALNKADGGLKDYYYPEWCRNLQLDPVWRQAADRRYDITWNHSPVQPQQSPYLPPVISVDPIPIGSFVRHPLLGEAYQFLCNRTVSNSAGLQGILPEGYEHDTTLLYPISLI